MATVSAVLVAQLPEQHVVGSSVQATANVASVRPQLLPVQVTHAQGGGDRAEYFIDSLFPVTGAQPSASKILRSVVSHILVRGLHDGELNAGPQLPG